MAIRKLWELETRDNDGSGNNLANLLWGATDSVLFRETPANYGPLRANGEPGERLYPQPLGTLGDDNGNLVPSQMVVLVNSLIKIGVAGDPASAVAENTAGLNELVAFYGQFLAHDTAVSAIPVPNGGAEKLFFNTGDPVFLDQINRTAGRFENGVFEQINGITGWFDHSALYGSGTAVGSRTRNDYLRTTNADGSLGAKLIEGASNLPTILEVRAVHGNDVPGFGGVGGLIAGDVRAAQQPFLGAIHSVWLLEHNSVVDRLAAEYGTAYTSLSGDAQFDAARIISEAEHQHIAYREYLAAIIGKDNVPDFTGYDPTVNGGVGNYWTTVAFRYGHDQQSENVQLVDANGAVTQTLTLSTSFRSIPLLNETLNPGIFEQLLRGMQVQKTQAVDGRLVPSLTDNVLGVPGLNLNLGLLGQVRALDHGIGTHNQVREGFGLAKYTSWDDFETKNGLDGAYVDKLAEFYGHIDNLDPYIGALVEKNVAGSQVGETIQASMIDQFTRSMVGDRFYYEHRLKDSPEILADIKGTTFAEIMDRDTGTEFSHLDSFHVAFKQVGNDRNNVIEGRDFNDYLDADLLIGSGGRDSLFGRDGSDTLYGGAGADSLNGGRGDDFLKGGADGDVITDDRGEDKAWGEGGNDTIGLGASDDWANGGDGNDSIRLGAGNDIGLGKAGRDRIEGGSGEDEAFGGEGDDSLHGDSGDDKLYGGAGRDLLSGGSDRDTLDGGLGNDDLVGGSSNDRFVFDKGDGRDTITDFQIGRDLVDLSALGASFDSLSEVKAAMTIRGSVVTLNLGDLDGKGVADAILFNGISSISRFTAASFDFVA